MEVGIKDGADIRGVRPEIVLAYTIVMYLYAKYDDGDIQCVITEGTGGKHGTASLHYLGLAIDLRIWGLSDSEKRSLLADITKALGRQFDVILESDHIHIEFQPK